MWFCQNLQKLFDFVFYEFLSSRTNFFFIIVSYRANLLQSKRNRVKSELIYCFSHGKSSYHGSSYSCCCIKIRWRSCDITHINKSCLYLYRLLHFLYQRWFLQPPCHPLLHPFLPWVVSCLAGSHLSQVTCLPRAKT